MNSIYVTFPRHKEEDGNATKIDSNNNTRGIWKKRERADSALALVVSIKYKERTMILVYC